MKKKKEKKKKEKKKTDESERDAAAADDGDDDDDIVRWRWLRGLSTTSTFFLPLSCDSLVVFFFSKKQILGFHAEFKKKFFSLSLSGSRTALLFERVERARFERRAPDLSANNNKKREEELSFLCIALGFKKEKERHVKPRAFS